jgi:hypothetical protein
VHPWAFHWLHEISIPKRVRHRLEPEWEMRRTEWGGSTRCIMHRVHTSSVKAHFSLKKIRWKLTPNDVDSFPWCTWRELCTYKMT